MNLKNLKNFIGEFDESSNSAVMTASVYVQNELISKIDKGLLILVGIVQGDTQKDCDFIKRKILNLRIFDDEVGFINKSIKDLDFEILFVSQFTLYADCSKGTRPSFSKAMPPAQARIFYDNFFKILKKIIQKLKTGFWELI